MSSKRAFKISLAVFLVDLFNLAFDSKAVCVCAQSVGYHQNLYLGFNPYLSPVYGYGVGLPYGAYGTSATKDPLLSSSLIGFPAYTTGNLMSKLHSKTFLKKWAPSGLPYYTAGLKSKLAMIKHPELAYTPYSLDYGYGKHYGTAVVPNNPYKGAYVDYYTGQEPAASVPKETNMNPDAFYGQPPVNADAALMKAHSVIKPLLKVGTILAGATLLGKKVLESPLVLNPAGMILNGRIY